MAKYFVENEKVHIVGFDDRRLGRDAIQLYEAISVTNKPNSVRHSSVETSVVGHDARKARTDEGASLLQEIALKAVS